MNHQSSWRMMNTNIFCGSTPNRLQDVPTTIPMNEPNAAEVDARFAKEMAQLSMQEREKAINDLHGVPDNMEEPPEFVVERLALLEEELDKIKMGTEYEQAELQSPDYVHHRGFRIMFLRSEFFKAKEAAARMIRFFREKMFLFGLEKLTKDIVYDDLDQDDIEALESGALQILPHADRSGRKVMFGVPGLRKFKTIKNFVSWCNTNLTDVF